MSEKLVFASNNKHKLEEIKAILSGKYEVISLIELGHLDELEETGNTLQENSLQKARFIYNKYKVNCFSEDTGLEVEALGGAPGVNTAMYAGEQRSATENIKLLLSNLNHKSNRNARFRTVITLILNGKEYQFEGEVNGMISEEIQGDDGFGYDPVFIPDGYSETFAKLSSGIKNKISHRAAAIKKLEKFLTDSV